MPRSIKGALFTTLHGRGRRRSILQSARSGDTDTINSVLTRWGGDVNSRFRSDQIVYGQLQDQATALIVAAGRGHLNVVDMLLQRGADVHARNRTGDTALIVAARNNHVDIINRLLSEDNININDQNNRGDTALIAAVRNGHEDAVVSLMRHGADPNIQNNLQQDAFFIASRHSRRMTNVLAVMFDTESAIAKYAYNRSNAAELKQRLQILVQLGMTLNEPVNERGDTLAIVAAQRGLLYTVLELLRSGADPNAQNNIGESLATILEADEHRFRTGRYSQFRSNLYDEIMRLIKLTPTVGGSQYKNAQARFKENKSKMQWGKKSG